jgi:hypothetical protein
VLEYTQARDEQRRVELLESLYCISAADCLATDEGSANGAEDAGASANQAKSGLVYDVWINMLRYKKAIVDADGSLFIFNAFADQLRKQSQITGSRVSALLHSLIKVFAGEQVRVWQDASLMLRNLAQPPSARRNSDTADVVVATPAPASASTGVVTGVVLSVNGATVDASSPGSSSPEREAEVEPSAEGDGENQVVEETPVLPVLPDCVLAAKVGIVRYIQGTKQSIQDLAAASSNSLQYTSEGGWQGSVASSGGRSGSAATSSSAAKEEGFSWRPAVAVVTFDHFLHLFKLDASPLPFYSESASNNCWINEEPVLTLDIANVEVEPILYAIAGLHDVFEVRPKTVVTSVPKAAGARRLSMSSGGGALSRANPNNGTTGAGVHLLLYCVNSGSTEEPQEWMRVISNPLSDSNTVVPESNSLSSLNASDINKQKSALLDSFVQPPPYVEGIEI